MSNPDGTPPYPEDERDAADVLEKMALAIARKHAKAKPPSYYAEPFQPHQWALDSIIEALEWAKDERDGMREELRKYRAWADSCDPSPAIQTALQLAEAELIIVEREIRGLAPEAHSKALPMIRELLKPRRNQASSTAPASAASMATVDSLPPVAAGSAPNTAANQRCPRCGFITSNVFACPTCIDPSTPFTRRS